MVKPIEHGPPEKWWSKQRPRGGGSPGADGPDPGTGHPGRWWLVGSACLLLLAAVLAVGSLHLLAVLVFLGGFAVAALGVKRSPEWETPAPTIMLTMVVVVLTSLGLFIYLGLWIMELSGTPVLR